MKDVETSPPNGRTPFQASTASEETSLCTSESSGRQNANSQLHGFATAGPGLLVACLSLNTLCTYLWYTLNLSLPNQKETQDQMLDRWTWNLFVLAPLGLTSVLGCLYCFAALLSPSDRRVGFIRVVVGGLIGAVVVVSAGVMSGVFEDELWIQHFFWAAAGVVPGAGSLALAGFCWDCLGASRKGDEDGDRDEKTPLLDGDWV